MPTDTRTQEARLAVAERIAALAVLPSPEDAVVAEESREQVRKVVLALPSRESSCVALRWFGGATYRQIGAKLGVCAGRAKQIHDRALDRLRIVPFGLLALARAGEGA